MPTTGDAAAWRTYVNDVVTRKMDGINNSPYVYFLPAEDTEGFGGLYERLLEKVEQDLGRGIIEGNMLAFASPAQEKTAEMIETAFKQVPAGTMKGQGAVRRHPDPRRARARRGGAGRRQLRVRRGQVSPAMSAK